MKNRLQQLSLATENDMKGWIYELLQNVKDSISGDPKMNSLNISIIVDDKKVEFRPDGSPFTADALFCILYKLSVEKRTLKAQEGLKQDFIPHIAFLKRFLNYDVS